MDKMDFHFFCIFTGLFFVCFLNVPVYAEVVFGYEIGEIDTAKEWKLKGSDLYLNRGDLEGALEAYKQATVLDPTYKEAWDGIANVWEEIGRGYYEQGEYEESINAYNNAMEALDPLNREIPLHYIGLAYENLEDYEKAAEFYQKEIDINPNDYYTWFFLGSCYEKLGKYPEAISAYEKAVTLPYDIDGYVIIGDLYVEIEDYQSAINAYNQALEYKPRDASIYEKLGDAYELMGEYQNAGIVRDKCFSENLRDASLYCSPES